MKAFKIGIGAVLIAVVAGGYVRAADEAKDVAALMKLEQARCKAFGEVNLPALADFLAEEYLQVHMTAKTENKAEYLEGMKDFPRSEISRGQDLKIRVYGDTAVMTGTQIRKTNGQTIEMFVTQVWVRRGGTWKLANFQATRKAPPANQ